MQKEIIIITYLSKFSYNKDDHLEVYTYKEVEHEDKEVHAILTNEAGIQDIYDSIEETEELKNRLHIIYFATEEVMKSQTKDVVIAEKKDKKLVVPEKIHERLIKEKLSAKEYFKAVANYHFQERFNTTLFDENFSEILAQNKSNEQLSQELLDIISHIAENKQLDTKEARKNIKIYVDTTGGFRDVSYLYVLLSQILSYTGYEKPTMVYSNIFGEKSISHIDNTFNLLKVTNAFHEFTSYGKVKALRDSLAEGCSQPVKELLDKMEAYSDDLALCRWDSFEAQMQGIKRDIGKIKEESDRDSANDRMFMLLIDEVSNKMGLHENATFGDILLANLTNCVENDMYQQAITLYREKLLGFLKTEIGFRTAFFEQAKRQDRSVKDELEFFLRGFDLMEYASSMQGENKEKGRQYSEWAKDKYEDIKGKIDRSKPVSYLDIFQSLELKTENLGDFTSKGYMIGKLKNCVEEKAVIMNCDKLTEVKVILRDYAIIHAMRNKICHSGADLLKFDDKLDDKIQAKFPLVKRTKEQLLAENKKVTDSAIIKQALLTAIDHLQKLRTQTGGDQTEPSE